MENDAIQIQRLADYPDTLSAAAARVFVEGYHKELSFISGDTQALERHFAPCLVPRAFYVALLEGEVVGIAACTNNQFRALRLNRGELRRSFGRLRGGLAYRFMEPEFHSPLTYTDETGYIECVATARTARGKGVCTALMRYILDELPYRKYMLEVVDTNTPAIRLYQRLGFTELTRKKERFGRWKGFQHRIYMRCITGDGGDA